MLTTETKVVQQEFEKGDKIYPLSSHSNGYNLVNLTEGTVENSSTYPGCIVIKCTKGYIFDFSRPNDTFTVYTKHFSLTDYNKPYLYEIF